MKASELVTELQNLIAIHGDKDLAFDDGWSLLAIESVDLSAEEDDCIAIYPT
jgi:hypothetical protein